MEYVETNCTFTHAGQQFTCGGAAVSGNRILAYLGKDRTLTDWHGKVLGTWRVVSSWRLPNSCYSTHMYQIEAKVNGVPYTGRSLGEGMSYSGRAKSTRR